MGRILNALYTRAGWQSVLRWTGTACVLTAAACDQPRPGGYYPDYVPTGETVESEADAGVDQAQSPATDGDAPRDGVPNAPPLPGEDAPLPDRLQGDYLMLATSRTQGSDVALGQLTTDTRLLAMVRITLEDEQLIAHERRCYVDFDLHSTNSSVLSAAMRIPSEVLQRTPFARRRISVSEDGDWQTERSPVPVSWQPEDDAAESLPTSPTDPRVFDLDGDGNVGFPIIADFEHEVFGQQQCTYHMVQRQDVVYSGKLRAGQLADGLAADVEAEQYAVSSGSFGCSAGDFNTAEAPTVLLNTVAIQRYRDDGAEALFDDFMQCPSRESMLAAFGESPRARIIER